MAGRASGFDPLERMQQIMELAARASGIAAKLQRNSLAQSEGADFSLVDLQTATAACLRSMTELAYNPLEMSLKMQQAWFAAAQAWSDAWMGHPRNVRDRRFRDPAWDADPVSRGIRDSFLAIEEAMQGLLDTLPAGSKDHLRTEFYTRQILSAFSPANFLGLNPVARSRFLETDGQSLIDGFSNFLDDLERGDGWFEIDTNDRSAFVVGRDLATTPGKVVYQNDLMQLIQYEPRTKTQFKRPMLLVPPWINKYYILDMRPKNSPVRYLLDRGHTVFVISWVNPTRDHADKAFSDYMTLGPLAALDAIREAIGEETVNILGFCIGGILVTITLAVVAARQEAHRIGSATTLATMVDFADVGDVGVFIDDDWLKALHTHMDKTGFLESHYLREMFGLLRENDLVWSFHVANYLMGRKPPAFDLLFWNSDSTRLPAAMLLWYIEKIYMANGLKKPGFLDLDGTPIDLGRITTPMFVLATKEDHIAPWKSVYPMTGLVGGDIKFVLGASGHIAGVINPPAQRPKYGYWTNSSHDAGPDAWLAGATFTEGSWWPAWGDWVEATDHSAQVPARIPGHGGLEVIEDAPGSYVLQP